MNVLVHFPSLYPLSFPALYFAPAYLHQKDKWTLSGSFHRRKVLFFLVIYVPFLATLFFCSFFFTLFFTQHNKKRLFFSLKEYFTNFLGSNPGGARFFAPVQTRPWGPPSILYNGYRVSFLWVKQRGVALSTRPYPAPRLKKE
jgi:hypothetical protein